MNYAVHITYEANHSCHKTRHSCWAGSKEQRKLIDYHKKMNIPLREIEYGTKYIPPK